MSPSIPLHDDMHVVVDLNEGAQPMRRLLDVAELGGIKRLCVVQHLSRSAGWRVEHLDLLRHLRRGLRIDLRLGVVARPINDLGDLDLSPQVFGLDHIYVVVDELPFGSTRLSLDAAQRMLATGDIRVSELTGRLVDAMINVMWQRPRVVLSRPFYLLRRLGLSEVDVASEMLDALAETAHLTGSAIELNEALSCPTRRVLEPFVDLGVPVHVGTESRYEERLAAYYYARGVAEQLGAPRYSGNKPLTSPYGAGTHLNAAAVA